MGMGFDDPATRKAWEERKARVVEAGCVRTRRASPVDRLRRSMKRSPRLRDGWVRVTADVIAAQMKQGVTNADLIGRAVIDKLFFLNPSPGASRHPLPQGERGVDGIDRKDV